MSDSILDAFMNTPLGDVEKPALLPPGTYIGTIVKHTSRNVKRGEVETPRLELQVKIIQADEDVDKELLSKVDLDKTYAYPGFDMDSRGQYAMQNFLAALFPESKGQKMSAFFPVLPGKQVMFKTTHTGGQKMGEDGMPIIYVNYNQLKPFV